MKGHTFKKMFPTQTHLEQHLKIVGKFYMDPPSRKCFLYKHIGNNLKMLGKFYMAPTWAVQFWGGPS